jgi:D-serine deaminase-like pyridoxal phosphate-dependent protein
MMNRPIEDLDTPALLLDRRLFERNLERMAAFFKGRPQKLRPHVKNHKCAPLARRQIACGAGAAIGMTCAKLGEAEVLADAGITNLLVANQVVGPAKVQRLADLARRVDALRVAVDDQGQVREIAAAARAAGVTVGLLVEVDIGMGRCGVAPGRPALDLARLIARSAADWSASRWPWPSKRAGRSSATDCRSRSSVAAQHPPTT